MLRLPKPPKTSNFDILAHLEATAGKEENGTDISDVEQDQGYATIKSEPPTTETFSQIWVKPKLTISKSTQQLNPILHLPLTFEKAVKKSEEQRCHIIPEAGPDTASPNPGDVFITQEPILSPKSDPKESDGNMPLHQPAAINGENTELHDTGESRWILR